MTAMVSRVPSSLLLLNSTMTNVLLMAITELLLFGLFHKVEKAKEFSFTLVTFVINCVIFFSTAKNSADKPNPNS